jgi:hypothetical protein
MLMVHLRRCECAYCIVLSLDDDDDEHANIVFESADDHSRSVDAFADADDDADDLDDETIIIVQEDEKVGCGREWWWWWWSGECD